MTKAILNHLLSLIAHKYETDIRRVCKEANIYYSPEWYNSIRGSREYDGFITRGINE